MNDTDPLFQGKLSPRGPRRHLALDGGGIRRVITLEVLAEIEQQPPATAPAWHVTSEQESWGLLILTSDARHLLLFARSSSAMVCSDPRLVLLALSWTVCAWVQCGNVAAV